MTLADLRGRAADRMGAGFIRLLAHGDQPAAKIAARLGFSSATNFSKFFHQRAGTSPLAFRHAVRGTAI
jgi:AraC-like DNA-binding protein